MLSSGPIVTATSLDTAENGPEVWRWLSLVPIEPEPVGASAVEVADPEPVRFVEHLPLLA